MTGPAVRPLPPEPPGPPATPGSSPAAPSPRRWLPFAIIGGALVVFVVGASVLSGGGGDAAAGPDAQVVAASTTTTSTIAVGLNGEPAASTTTIPPPTTTTIPPRLDAVVPDIAPETQVVFTDDQDIAWIANWHRAANEPAAARVLATELLVATYDQLGNLALLDGWYSPSLSVGDDHFVSSLFSGATSVAWHAGRGGELAWIGQPPGETGLALYRAVLPDSGPQGANIGPLDVSIVERIAAVPTDARLAGWGDWGFAIQVPALDGFSLVRYPDPNAPDGAVLEAELQGLWILDPTGAVTGSMPATFSAVAPDGSMIVRSQFDAYTHMLSEGHTPEDLGMAEPVKTGALERRNRLTSGYLVVGPRLGRRDVVLPPGAESLHTFTPDGETVVAVSNEATRLNVTSQRRDGTRRRLTQVVGAAVFHGFTRDGRYVIASAGPDDPSALIFHDWLAGTSFGLRFDPEPITLRWIVAVG